MGKRLRRKIAAAIGVYIGLLDFHGNALFCEVLGCACVEGSGHTGGCVLNGQLSALAVLNSDGIGILEDGLLDVCAINKVSRLTFLSLVSQYKNGTYLKNKLG